MDLKQKLNWWDLKDYFGRVSDQQTLWFNLSLNICPYMFVCFFFEEGVVTGFTKQEMSWWIEHLQVTDWAFIDFESTWDNHSGFDTDILNMYLEILLWKLKSEQSYSFEFSPWSWIFMFIFFCNSCEDRCPFHSRTCANGKPACAKHCRFPKEKRAAHGLQGRENPWFNFVLEFPILSF